ncbi:expressed unknown protein [Seminavis robusta]|uniref:Wax synthase domain-containing protein n=1 Tax=Seminavis robusta TaxID=568900 RepID=A0A9N8DDL7_9STRA|nr:expressed unknown protein [Seminavis robusta]|eukprot:Sro46_g027300.1 n/a (378) ;mRNA; f:13577-14710
MMTTAVDADVVVSIIGAVSTVCAAFALAPTTKDAVLFSTCFWLPLLGLQWIRQRRPWMAASVNAVGFLLIWQIPDRHVWRPFATAMTFFATTRAYDYAIHYPHLSAARHYAGTIMKLNTTQPRKHVLRMADCFPFETILDLLVTIMIVAVCVMVGIPQCQEWQSPEYPTTVGLQLPHYWRDWIVMHIRCGLIGIAFGYGIHLLQFLYGLWYAPFRIIHTQAVMNHPLLATSLTEFWSYRWNRLFHGFLKRNIYTPLLLHNNNKHYCNNNNNNKAMAVIGTFAFSGLCHVLVLEGGVERSMRANLGCMAFFLCQALLILVEQRIFFTNNNNNNNNQPKTQQPQSTASMIANRLFTYVSLLATAPLLIEPSLRTTTHPS